MTLIIHAPNVHQGGGEALLKGLLQGLKEPAILHLDARLGSLPDLPSGVEIARVQPSLLGRLGIEWRLKQRVLPGDYLLCFGNLPPIFPVQGQVTVFLQNAYLIRPSLENTLPWKIRTRLWVERLWLRAFLRKSKVVVQTETMSRLVKTALGVDCTILPFLPAKLQTGADNSQQPPSSKQSFDFLYVASAEPHKNHLRLFEAWRLLASGGHYPTLCVTIPRNTYPKIEAELARTIAAGAKVSNLGAQNPDELSSLYENSHCLIYPSLFESFGLPLIEAQQFGLVLVAAELDYVRDVAAPEHTFDPTSAVSIARAVRRSMGQIISTPEPLDAEAFLSSIKGRS